MKKQLIKEVDTSGQIFYFTQVNDVRVTPFTSNYKYALNDFVSYGKNIPSVEVLLEETINPK
jgi:hypothetical protein